MYFFSIFVIMNDNRLKFTQTQQNQLPISINDLRERYYDGHSLSEQEFLAIQNFDKYRLAYLNSSENEEEFDKRFIEIQSKANLSPYTDFI